MTRVKRGVTSLKRRRKILKQTKGFRWGRKSKERAAQEALLHAGVHSFNDRRKKKRDFRKLWQVKIGAGSKQSGVSYSKMMGGLKKSGILINRKMLAALAEHKPAVFKKILEEVK